MEKKTFDRKTILKICVSVLTGLLLVLLMDIDQFIAAYKMYGGYIPNYEISNVGISADTLDKIQGNTILRLYVSRYFLTVLPISIFFIVICFFKDNQYYLKDKSFFEDNPHMSSIVLILRWILGILIAGFILNFNRNMFNDTFHNCLIGRDEDFFRIIFAFFALTVFVIDPRKFFSSAKSLRRIHPKFYTFLFMLVVSYISCCLLEFQSASKMQFVSYMLFFNCLYWFLLQLFFLILLRRVKTVATISLIVSYAIGLANDIVYQFRGNYIMFGDLTVIRTAVEVVGNYTYSPTMWFFIALVLFIISLII
nr:hypothetical protein [Lachnospiraceae bacterium]